MHGGYGNHSVQADCPAHIGDRSPPLVEGSLVDERPVFWPDLSDVRIDVEILL